MSDWPPSPEPLGSDEPGTFALVTFPAVALHGLVLPPDAVRGLTQDGVPRRFLGDAYRADSILEALPEAPGGPLVRFGTSGMDTAVCVTLDGEVVEVPDPAGDRVTFVNSTVAQFTSTVRALLARYPYYRTDAEDAHLEAVAEEALRIVRELDEPAARDGASWSEFVEELRMGDFAVELLMDRPDRGVRR